MKIVKPMSLSVLHRPYPFLGRAYMAVAALGFFRLGAPAARLLPDAAQWPLALAALPAGMALDDVMPKPRGEALVLGRACAPGGKQVTSMCVRLAIGTIDKRLRVTGERGWRHGLLRLRQVADPAPFSTMPLTWERAHGGPGHAANPLGCGHAARFGGARAGCMPNVEYCDEAKAARGRAAGFAPLPSDHAPRKGKLGTYDARWLAQEAPGFASDIDWSAFNLAPEDQWLSGYFHGDEPYRLEGLHPERPSIEGRLPGVRARAFIQEGGAAPREVPLALDTVWFLPDHDLGVLAFHGRVGIADIDGLGVTAVMAGYERLAEPRPLAHYHEVLRLRSDPLQAAEHVFNEGQLAPAPDPADAARDAAADAAEHAARLAQQQQRLDELAREHWRLQGTPGTQGAMAPAAPHAAEAPFAAPGARALASGDFDLAPMMRAARRAAEQARTQAAAALAGLARPEAAPPAPEAERDAALERAQVPAYDLLPALETGRDPVAAERLAQLDRLAGEGQLDADAHAKARAALAAAPAQQRAVRRATPAAAPGPRLGPSAAATLGQQALRWHDSGIGLAGRDLAGADLRGARLAGADLRETMLEGADLSGADLTGADLRGAVLAGALLRGASLARARLDEANLSGCDADGACLRGASLCAANASDARLCRADLSGAVLDRLLAPRMMLVEAVLDGVRADAATLVQADARGSRWHGARCDKLVALRAQLAGADFSGVRFTACAVNEADLRASRWDRAVLDGLQAAGATCFAGASLRGVRAGKCGLHGADLAGADLQAGHWLRCDFSHARLDRALLDRARFPHSVFMGASLAGASAVDADFYQAVCRQADLRGARLAGAAFVQAELTGALTGAATGAQAGSPAAQEQP